MMKNTFQQREIDYVFSNASWDSSNKSTTEYKGNILFSILAYWNWRSVALSFFSWKEL